MATQADALKFTEMKSLAECTNKLTAQGYIAQFKVDENGVLNADDKTFKPEDVIIVNFFRFEGFSDPEDNSILYAIEASDGTKGTLVDAYGPYADANVSEFIKKVEEMQKKV